MTMPDNTDLDPKVIIAAVTSLSTNVNALSGNVGELATTTRKNRRYIWWLAASLLFDMLLSLGLGAVAWQAHTASDKAREASSILAVAQRNTCISSNEARKVQRDLWGFVLDLPPTTPRTAAEEKQIEVFRSYVDTKFAARKC